MAVAFRIQLLPYILPELAFYVKGCILTYSRFRCIIGVERSTPRRAFLLVNRARENKVPSLTEGPLWVERSTDD
jgi:hypothetical protein